MCSVEVRNINYRALILYIGKVKSSKIINENGNRLH
jgi:hypothetical protein